MSKFTVAVCVLAAALGACTKKNPAFCDTSADCTDPSKPFCDVSGEVGGLMNACIASPPDGAITALDAPASGCTPGAAIDCSGDSLTTCGSDGHTTAASDCALGCATSGATRCLTFEPSNGLGPALADAAAEPAVTIPRGSTINTDTGAVADSSGTAITVKTEVVTPATGPKIRVLLGGAFSIDDVAVTGVAALAIVAPGEIHIVGKIDASAHSTMSGPGVVVAPNSCIAPTIASGTSCSVINTCPGRATGGGGHATAGANGGPTGADGSASGTGGQPRADSAEFGGGCSGGASTRVSGNTITTDGGAGGGAVQLVSLISVKLDTAGVIDVGGGGGGPSLGGGAGGTIVIETPSLSVSGPSSGLVANGGAGGGCGSNGPDGAFSTTPAQGPQCSPESAGNGGTASVPPTAGFNCAALGTCGVTNGGGGGSVGTLHVATRDSSFTLAANPVMSALTTATTLVTQ